MAEQNKTTQHAQLRTQQSVKTCTPNQQCTSQTRETHRGAAKRWRNSTCVNTFSENTQPKRHSAGGHITNKHCINDTTPNGVRNIKPTSNYTQNSCSLSMHRMVDVDSPPKNVPTAAQVSPTKKKDHKTAPPREE